MASPDGFGYNKRPGSGNDHEHLYEVKMSCLMFVRGIRLGSFHLATNLDGAGAFDDVVLQLHKPSRTFFINLKHKIDKRVQQRPGLTSTLAKKDFSLLRYFKSYRDDICPQFQIENQHQIYNSELENCVFVLYTNSRLQGEPEVSDHQDELLSNSPGGLTFSFIKDRDDDVVNFAQHIDSYRKFLEDLHEKVKGINDVSTIFKSEASKYRNNYKKKHLSKIQKGNIHIWEMANQLKNNPTLKQLLEQKNKLLTLGDLSGYHSFLESLKVCTRQCTENTLDVAINEELSETLGISKSRSAILVKNLLENIRTWWKCENGMFLTEQSLLWNETIEKALHLINEETLCKLKGLGIRFNECEIVELMNRVVNSRVVLCLVKSNCTSLSMCKVVEVLERKQLKYVLGQSEDSLLFWQNPWCPLLVVECRKQIHKMLPVFHQVLEHHPDKRLILVARENDLQTVDWLVQNDIVQIEDEVSLASLHEDTLKQVLDMDVKFQGDIIPLKKLIRDEKVLMKGVKADILFNIFKGKMITIGVSLEPGLKHYIPRTLQKEDIVQIDMMKEILLLDNLIVTISGASKEDVQKLVPTKIHVHKFSGHLVPKCKCYIVENDTDIASIKLQSQDLLCLVKQQHSFKIHAHKCKNSHYIKPTKSILWADSAWDIPERIAIIVDDPGMGKSTLMMHMAQKSRRYYPDVWVVLAKLNNMSAYLSSVTVKDLNSETAVNFLATAANLTGPFEMLLLKNSVNTTGNVIVLVDGFDEICPDYKEVVIGILELLLHTNIVKICLTSRRNWKHTLEQSLFSIAFTMNEFTSDDQRKFLHQVWSENVPNINRSYIHSFITDVLNVFSESDSGVARKFMGVPLQTMLVAEVYEQYIKNYHETSLKVTYMDIVQLYQAFFDKKCHAYFVEKRGDDIAKPIVKRGKKKEKMNIAKNHTYVALIAYFSSNNLKTLHDKSVIKKGFKYLQQEIYEWLLIGVIHSVIDRKPKFLHRTIMEFFVAKWIAKYFKHNMMFLNDHFLMDDFSGVRTMLNVIMTRGFDYHTAILNRNLYVLRKTLGGEDVNAKDNGGRTLLHIAVITDGGHHLAREMLEFLLDRGADVDAIDALLHWTPVQYADYIGNWEAMGIILQKRKLASELVFITSHKVQALVEACRYGFVELLIYLLQIGVDVNVSVDHCKRTALQLAAGHGQVEVIHRLLCSGADVNTRDIYDATALHVAVNSGSIASVKCLLEAGANVMMADMYGHTALHLGAKNGHFDIVKYLLEFKANIMAEDITGCTPLDLAIASRNFEIVKL